MGKRCMGCGHESKSLALVEHEAGEMREVMIGKKKMADDPYHLWRQVTTYTREHGNPDTSYGRACHTFRRMTGEFPPKGWHISAPAATITRAVLDNIRGSMIRYAKGKAKGAR